MMTANPPTPNLPVRHDGAENLMPVDRAAVLRHLGLDERNPATHALVAVANTFGLNPLLNHVALINTQAGKKVYITRDGLLHVAHRSGQLNGIQVEVHEGETGWGATATVYRKDMDYPFVYSAGCGKQEPQARRGHGPEMAIARAERRALSRAFAVALPTGDAVLDGDYHMEQSPHSVAAWNVQDSAGDTVTDVLDVAEIDEADAAAAAA